MDPPQPEIAFLGRSNVGKSSLLNALVGRRRLARTSGTPGKTQMCNVFAVHDGYYLVDLPGYGYARASKDSRKRFQRLISDYVTKRQGVAGIIWLLDIRRTPSAEDQRMADLLATTDVPVLAVATKADKIPRGRRKQHTDDILKSIGVAEDQLAVTSAYTREGIEELQVAMAAFLRSSRT